MLQNARVFPVIKKRFMQLIIPYFFFIFVITVIRYVLLVFSQELTVDFILTDIRHILFGGRFPEARMESFGLLLPSLRHIYYFY